MPTIGSRIRRHLADPDSNHRRIVTGFLWVSIFMLIGKLAGAAKEMAIAWRYGLGATVDAYVFIFNLVNWPVSVSFSILTVVLVPLAVKLRSDSPENLSRFRSELLAFTLLLGACLGLLAWFGLPLLLDLGWVELSGEAMQQALVMARPLSLMLPLGLIIGLFSAWMMACGHYRNTLLEAMPALVILIALLLPPDWLSDPLVWGTVAGFSLQLVGLGWLLRRAGELQAPRLGFHSPAWQGFLGSIGIMSVGQLLTSFSSIIDQFFAANLGVGALSSLSYANRIMALVLSMGAVAISRATLPVFSRAYTQSGVDVTALALRWTRWMFTAGLVVVALGGIAAAVIVELLFERGAFTHANAQSVTTLLRYALIQTPFYFAGLVMVSALAAAKRYFMIALSGVMNLLFKLLFAYFLVKSFHLVGLLLSTAAMYAMSLLLLYVAVRKAPAVQNQPQGRERA